MMDQAIKNFPKQFSWEPVVKNTGHLKRHQVIIISGMGGSHLAADILNEIHPDLGLVVHKNYGLPNLSKMHLKDAMFIASSYSGNTEEVIDGLEKALERGIDSAVVSVGGKLLEMARDKNLPYIQLPDVGIQPRSALGYSLRSMMKLIGDEEGLRETAKLAGSLNAEALEKEGKALAEEMKNHVPIIYTSWARKSVAYNWKIKFNETGKIPAFFNVFSELNHNEMTGFDINDKNKSLSEKFFVIFIKDESDDPRIQKRMDLTEQLYKNRGIKTKMLNFTGKDSLEKIFNSLLLADWTAYYTALFYGSDPENVPMVEEFKKQLRNTN